MRKVLIKFMYGGVCYDEKFKIAVLPGDGIGPEVVKQALRF